eukprot:Opistho-1_new@50414
MLLGGGRGRGLLHGGRGGGRLALGEVLLAAAEPAERREPLLERAKAARRGRRGGCGGHHRLCRERRHRVVGLDVRQVRSDVAVAELGLHAQGGELGARLVGDVDAEVDQVRVRLLKQELELLVVAELVGVRLRKHDNRKRKLGRVAVGLAPARLPPRQNVHQHALVLERVRAVVEGLAEAKAVRARRRAKLLVQLLDDLLGSPRRRHVELHRLVALQRNLNLDGLAEADGLNLVLARGQLAVLRVVNRVHAEVGVRGHLRVGEAVNHALEMEAQVAHKLARGDARRAQHGEEQPVAQVDDAAGLRRVDELLDDLAVHLALEVRQAQARLDDRLDQRHRVRHVLGLEQGAENVDGLLVERAVVRVQLAVGQGEKGLRDRLVAVAKHGIRGVEGRDLRFLRRLELADELLRLRLGGDLGRDHVLQRLDPPLAVRLRLGDEVVRLAARVEHKRPLAGLLTHDVDGREDRAEAVELNRLHAEGVLGRLVAVKRVVAEDKPAAVVHRLAALDEPALLGTGRSATLALELAAGLERVGPVGSVLRQLARKLVQALVRRDGKVVGATVGGGLGLGRHDRVEVKRVLRVLRVGAANRQLLNLLVVVRAHLVEEVNPRRAVFWRVARNVHRLVREHEPDAVLLPGLGRRRLKQPGELREGDFLVDGLALVVALVNEERSVTQHDPDGLPHAKLAAGLLQPPAAVAVGLAAVDRHAAVLDNDPALLPRAAELGVDHPPHEALLRDLVFLLLRRRLLVVVVVVRTLLGGNVVDGGTEGGVELIEGAEAVERVVRLLHELGLFFGALLRGRSLLRLALVLSLNRLLGLERLGDLLRERRGLGVFLVLALLLRALLLALLLFLLLAQLLELVEAVLLLQPLHPCTLR